MKIKITNEALKALPSASISIVLVKKLQNRIDDRTIPILLNAEEVKIRGLGLNHQDKNLLADTKDSDLYLNKLFEVILSGKDIQRFNPLRDLCTLTALRFHQPVFAITLEAGDPDIIFDVTKPTEQSSPHHQHQISELLCENTHGSIFNFIEGIPSDLAKVIPQTETALVFLVASQKNTAEQSQLARREIVSSITKLLSGQCDTFEISQAQSEVELELQ